MKDVGLMGCHSSTVRFHCGMLRHVNRYTDDRFRTHCYSLPMDREFPLHSCYIWVQRDPTITAISQQRRPEIPSGNRMEDVWQGMAEAADAFRFFRRSVLYVWAQDTVRDPVNTMQRMGDFIGVDHLFTEDDIHEMPFDPDAKYLAEARLNGVGGV